MRVLHVGYAFSPWIGGGLIESSEDLMEYQVKKGNEVFYFFPASYSVFKKGPFLKKWERNGVKMLELVNSPIPFGADSGSLRPDLEINLLPIDNLFQELLREIKPQVVHFQSFPQIPTSIIDITHQLKIPTIMTLQDYYLLCPTLKLWDFNEQICEEIGDGLKCYLCCINGAKDNLEPLLHTFQFNLPKKIGRVVDFIGKGTIKIYRILSSKKELSKKTLFDEEKKKAFLIRRFKNIERLKKITILIAMSKKVKEIYSTYTHRNDIEQFHFSVKNISSIQYQKKKVIEKPIKFVTLNGAVGRAKGVHLLTEAFYKLSLSHPQEYELHIWGGLNEREGRRLLAIPNVFYHGPYERDKLDKILGNYDVGIVPSVWEEAFGFVGVEMLAKGMPVIGNNRGGIIDYVKEGVSGWVNYSNDGAGLYSILKQIIESPSQILELNIYRKRI